MPTNDHLFFTAAAAWLRAQVDHFRRSVMSQRPAVRWGMLLLVVIGLTSAIYWAAASFSTLSVRYLVSGRRFSSDDLIKVCSALDKQRVNYRVDDSRRVEVASDQYDQAADVVAKLDFGQRPIGDIREQSNLPSIFRISRRPGKPTEPRSRKNHRRTDWSARRRCLVAGVDRPPEIFKVAPGEREAEGLCLHRDRGKSAATLSDGPVDPGDLDGLRERSDPGSDHRDGPARVPIF